MIPCNSFTSFSPNLIIVKEDEIYLAFDHHSGKTVTLGKYVAEYEQMRKWMIEFLSKFQGRGFKIARDNSIHAAKP